jgi:hypothetical protein
MKTVTDINGIEIEVGDLVVYPSQGSLVKSIVLGFTENSIILSCSRRKWINGNYENHSKGIIFKYPNNPTLHNSKFYKYPYNSFLILEKNINIPDNLIKFVKK